MKNKTIKIILITIIALASFKANAQKEIDRNFLNRSLNVTKSFFRAPGFRIAAGLSMDTSVGDKKTGKGYFMQPSGNSNIDKENIRFSGAADLTLGLGVDIYSPLSTLGFYLEPSYNIKKYIVKSVAENFPVRDSINVGSFDMPVYAKLRFGNVFSKNHLWLALGGGYSFVLNAKTKVAYGENSELKQLNTKKQFKSVPYLSGILGYERLIPIGKAKGREVFNRDDFRILFFVKANYDLASRIDNSGTYKDTALSTYDNPELQFLQVSVGIKILMRFQKLGAMVGQVAMQSLQNQ